MARRKEPKLQPGELPYSVQIELAIEDYNNDLAKDPLKASMRDSAKRRGVSWTTIRDRILLCIKKSKAEEAQNR